MIDFRQEAKARAGSRWRGLSETERRRRTRAAKIAWLREQLGDPGERETYANWFETQPRAFQDRVSRVNYFFRCATVISAGERPG